jgi:murein DD-endopeptidase MepM/ murein hydrolase activator NlpD
VNALRPVRAAAALAALGISACSPPVAPRSAPSPTVPHERIAAALSGMIWPLPVQGSREISSTYGVRGVRHHDGVDIRGGAGTPIHAARDGRVVFSGWMRGYGNIVILDHGEGVTTRYAHASQLIARVGDRVTRGQTIALVGATGNATGNHLHFEILWAGRAIDPALLLPRVSAR